MQIELCLLLITFLTNFEVILTKAATKGPRKDYQQRIVGGKKAKINDFPYQVSLMMYGEHFCGGSIIDKRWILTAAHCTRGAHPSELSVRAGSTFNTKDGSVHRVLHIYEHPLYDDDTVDYDFALLQLMTQIRYSSKAQPVELADPTDGQLETGTQLMVSGWGATEDEAISNVLRAVSVPLISQDECARLYPNELTDRMFCAGYVKWGTKDACQGDSGGPIVAYGIQYGVVSWGEGCGIAGSPGVYSKISDQRSWIEGVTGV